MTNLTLACRHILRQLYGVIQQLDSSDYCRPSAALSGSSIGQHVRHTLEFFFCFQRGLETGVVSYDKRAHDKTFETNKLIALEAIDKISLFVEGLDLNAFLRLEVGYSLKNDDSITLDTNASRELVYNIEHAIHHMAIMKIGILEVAPYVGIDHDFGVAASTVRYYEAAR